jgi:hypothetical protein
LSIIRKIFLTRFSGLSSSSGSLAIDIVNILPINPATQVEDLAWSCLRLRWSVDHLEPRPSYLLRIGWPSASAQKAELW